MAKGPVAARRGAAAAAAPQSSSSALQAALRVTLPSERSAAWHRYQLFYTDADWETSIHCDPTNCHKWLLYISNTVVTAPRRCFGLFLESYSGPFETLCLSPGDMIFGGPVFFENNDMGPPGYRNIYHAGGTARPQPHQRHAGAIRRSVSSVALRKLTLGPTPPRPLGSAALPPRSRAAPRRDPRAGARAARLAAAPARQRASRGDRRTPSPGTRGARKSRKIASPPWELRRLLCFERRGGGVDRGHSVEQRFFCSEAFVVAPAVREVFCRLFCLPGSARAHTQLQRVMGE